MRWLSRGLSLMAFTFEYIIPLVLFGGVIPYTHDGVAAGLTAMGYIAVGILIFILIRKAKERVIKMNKGVLRALTLTAFKIVPWLLIGLALKWVSLFAIKFLCYWWEAGIFLAIGCLFDVIAEAIYEREVAADVAN